MSVMCYGWRTFRPVQYSIYHRVFQLNKYILRDALHWRELSWVYVGTIVQTKEIDCLTYAVDLEIKERMSRCILYCISKQLLDKSCYILKFNSLCKWGKLKGYQLRKLFPETKGMFFIECTKTRDAVITDYIREKAGFI